ncbi:MAG TPA: sugar transferase [Acidobacteriaceae bacterium]|jgi:Undecaprenyl-phosphate galactose phosphotransferase WbaP|nr:sugar transferase [Acidobacteriaceae bacterium]
MGEDGSGYDAGAEIPGPGEAADEDMSLDLHSQEPESILLGARSFELPEGVGETERWRARREPGPEQMFRYRVLKRCMDIVVVLLLSPVWLPLLGVVAAMVRLSSPGPIFFSHRRIRRHGEFFSMWKFRTMCINSGEVLENYLNANGEARAEWRKMHKLRCDPRVTRVGRFLRKTSLDELPQMWNVLTGTMSLVGPRPIVAAEVEKYGEFFADYCLVKPGITGLWQVSGRSELTYPQRVQLDRQYAHHWTLRADLMILVRTLSSVVNRDGAY